MPPSTTPHIPLYNRMFMRAVLDGLPDDHPMFTESQHLQKVIHDYYAEPPQVGPLTYVATWAKASFVWTDYTGISAETEQYD